jgi:hypothetical protein
MSLLMDYMPEFYSSNINQFVSLKAKTKSIKQSEVLKSSKVFYMLKNDQISIVSKPFLDSSSSEESAKIQYSIQDELLKLLTEQPHKFMPLSLPDTFNCSNKQKGLHRDPFDCTKYYYCMDNTGNENFYEFFGKKSSISDNFIQTKAYICPKDAIFNMNGCFCDRGLDRDSNCVYLSESFCDITKFRKFKKTFA